MVVIIGAGLTGLSAAYHLQRHGITDIFICEKNNEPGGLLRTTRTKGLPLTIPVIFFISMMTTLHPFSKRFVIFQRLPEFIEHLLYIRMAESIHTRFK